MYEVGLRIKTRRLELGMTQAELAKKMGYTSKAAISKVECNDEKMTMPRIQKFAEALGVTPSYLLGWNEVSRSDFFEAPKEDSDLNNFVRKLNYSQKVQLLAVAKAMFPEVK